MADPRDWLVWLDAARDLAVAAGQQHRLHYTITSEALTRRCSARPSRFTWQWRARRLVIAGLMMTPLRL